MFCFTKGSVTLGPEGLADFEFLNFFLGYFRDLEINFFRSIIIFFITQRRKDHL